MALWGDAGPAPQPQVQQQAAQHVLPQLLGGAASPAQTLHSLQQLHGKVAGRGFLQQLAHQRHPCMTPAKLQVWPLVNARVVLVLAGHVAMITGSLPEICSMLCRLEGLSSRTAVNSRSTSTALDCSKSSASPLDRSANCQCQLQAICL